INEVSYFHSCGTSKGGGGVFCLCSLCEGNEYMVSNYEFRIQNSEFRVKGGGGGALGSGSEQNRKDRLQDSQHHFHQHSFLQPTFFERHFICSFQDPAYIFQDLQCNA